MSVEIAWKQNILVTDFQLLKSMLVVFGFGSQAFVCGFSRQNICSVGRVWWKRWKKASPALDQKEKKTQLISLLERLTFENQ